MASVIWLELPSGEPFVTMVTYSSTTDECYQLCVNSGFLSLARSHANVTCVTLTYQPAVEEVLELVFRERKWFLRGTILLEGRIGWKLVYYEY